MILVTVGTEKFPFDRLMRWIDALIRQGFLLEDEEIIVQYGTCQFLPSGVKVYSLLPEIKFRQLMASARLIIAHCGEGTINLLEETNTPYILVPRSSKLQEHIDDHQIELALALSQSDVPIAWSPGDLARFLAKPQYRSSSVVPESNVMALCQNLEARFAPK
ncbi:MAG TPA: glucosyl transferase [Cyanobacteria bacterium UBA11149]|nr:glucosyl transferase [Cyanobacteria bacterium UBA11367]HBE57027.1 glucosyl transferase [Cyanobacteria bacterium UBA11366]HBK66754.1 glucosyl transferase [Cyanobacteria bacterium UBA11166]HBR73043.1 glucosyl transferase [Cyanobacteria bacterium UBA11159]HBS72742.1 glucosyl transferase [Cyanobacteria bacterium UBA11153]HBW88864.1 glucosyl transferase [Cyanobacteria bacterium UBA11149]HCA97027.1 glucosyl transferase [Cyanobacteria bacterium UBA9226]